MKLFLSLLLICTLTSFGQILIKPTAKCFSYEGRFDFGTEAMARFSYSGSTIYFTLDGSAVDLFLGTEKTNRNQVYYTILVNNKLYDVVKVTQTKRKYSLKLYTKGIYKVKIFKRTEAAVGTGLFYGVTPIDGKLIKNTPEFDVKLMVIGNSITCGYGNLFAFDPKKDNNQHFTPANEDNYQSWATLLTNSLNAERHTIAFSGKGIYQNGNESKTETMPQLFDFMNPFDTTVSWNHKNYQANVIVINLGTNDFRDKNLEEAKFVSAYIDFVEKLKRLYPEAKIVCCSGPMLGQALPKLRACVKTVVYNFKKDVYAFEFAAQKAPLGEDYHPNVHTHKTMANNITPFIEGLLK
ncbi:GDSL-type esterase/lipase family protein [Flavobacteriaceae bacterium]|nr:GDSL-type esterase/lipase family protein [Flavobacteriaceae bacterium]